MATKTQALQGALSDLLDSLYDMGIDEDTVAIAAESRKNRESLHSDVLLQRIVAAKAALAMPMRNCEVGTAEEQYIRYKRNFCPKHCHEPCRVCPAGIGLDCRFTWAQMPYEAEDGGAK